MTSGIRTIVFPVEDMTTAKTLFGALVGAAPYADEAYYVGFRIGDQEIGLDPNASGGPIGYVDTTDIQSSLKALVEAGAEVVQDAMDVGGGMLVARLKDADGNFLGLRQSP